MEREQQPRRRNPSASHLNRDSAPERRRKSPEASGDMPVSGDKRRKQSRPASARNAASRGRDGQRQKTTQERQHRRKQQLRRQKQQRKIEKAEKRRSEAQRRPVKPFVRRVFFLRLGATLAVVLALIVAMTIFFKVDSVQVSGNVKYSAQEVISASGIDVGENLMLLSKSGIAGRIHAALPYVGDIQVGIKFPNTVNIDIVEQSAVFTIQDESGLWWLLSGDGTVLESTDASGDDCIRIEGAVVKEPVAGESFRLAEKTGETEATENTQPTETTAPTEESAPTEENGTTGESVPEETTVVLNREEALLVIMAALTACDRGGDITVVDVEDLYNIQVWYGNSFRILLDDTTELSYKVRYMVQAVEKLTADGYRGGVLDLSFREDGQAVFTPW